MGSRLPHDRARHNPRGNARKQGAAFPAGSRVARVPDDDVDSWEPLRSELAADVGRVADRLRSMSQARLAGMPAPPENGFPPYHGRAQAGRAVAESMAHVASCLEGAAVGQPHLGWRALPALSDFAAGDQVAVAGRDLLAALDLVGPDDEVWFDTYAQAPARTEVERMQRLLADLRRRL